MTTSKYGAGGYMGLSFRAYAAHRKSKGLRGGSLMAVQKAIRSGRIALLPDGKIDAEQADLMWKENTIDLGIALPEYETNNTTEYKEAAPNSLREDSHSVNNANTAIYKIRQRREFVRLQEAEISLKHRKELLVDVEEVSKQWAEIGRITRNLLESLPQRVKSDAPDMPDEHIRFIEACVNQVMSEFARHTYR